MRSYLRVAGLVLGFGLAAGLASAQVAEIGISGGVGKMRNNDLGGLAEAGTAFTVDSGFRLGVRFTLNTYRYFGHEVGYSYNRSKLKAAGEELSMPSHQFGYAFVAHATPEGSMIRPFVAGGGHFSSYYPPGSSVYYGNGYTKFGFNYGGGIKVKVSPMFGIRVDVRDYVNGKPLSFQDTKGLLHQLETSAGLSIVF